MKKTKSSKKIVLKITMSMTVMQGIWQQYLKMTEGWRHMSKGPCDGDQQQERWSMVVSHMEAPV